MDNISFNEVEEIIRKKLDSFFPVPNRFIEVNPGRVYLPRKYAEIGNEIRNLPVRNDDVWLISYPRTGSTWAQEMIWLLGNNLDYEGAKQIQLVRVPIIELTALFSEDHHEWVSNSIGNSVDCIKNLPSPRFIKSHLPWSLLPKELETVKPKIIYTARNPKDLCVSLYNHYKQVHRLQGTLENFCELFIDEIPPLGSYWTHVLSFWKRRNDPNILFLKYEDMKKDIRKTIEKCANFLEIDYELTTNDLDKICEYLKIENMRLNPAVNFQPIIENFNNNGNTHIDYHENGNENGDEHDSKFIRKGKIGDWRNYISNELSEKFDKWTEKNTEGSDLTFNFE